eukprot:UN16254
MNSIFICSCTWWPRSLSSLPFQGRARILQATPLKYEGILCTDREKNVRNVHSYPA